MTKIENFEKRLIEQGMTEDDFEEYKKLLKYVHGAFQKRQHCYTTAIQFPLERAGQALQLIQYALAYFDDEGWFSTYTCYLYMGQIYKASGNYFQAYEHYLLAKSVLTDEQKLYFPSISLELLWIRLHMDCFRYSTEVEQYFHCAEKAGEFEFATMENEFRMEVAKTVIFLHHGETDEAQQSYDRAVQICQPGFVGKFQHIFGKHGHEDQLKATPESIRFLKSLKF